MKHKTSIVVLLFVGAILLGLVTASSMHQRLKTCKCRRITTNPRGKCWRFVNKESRICQMHKCGPSYVCDESRGTNICRWKIFHTAIVKDSGKNTCKTIKKITKEPVFVKKIPKFRPRLVNIFKISSSKIRYGSPTAVLKHPHYTQGFNAERCLITFKRRKSFWRGDFSQAMTIDSVVITPQQGQLNQIRSLRVYAGNRGCRRITPIKPFTTECVYKCRRAISTYVQLKKFHASIHVCGIDVYGEVFKRTPVPLPYDLRRMTMLQFSKAIWSGQPQSYAYEVIQDSDRNKPRRCLESLTNGGWWYGTLKSSKRINLVVLINQRGRKNWMAMNLVKVYVGAERCVRMTNITNKTSRVFFDCKGRRASTIRVKADRNFKLVLCGIEAHGSSSRKAIG